MATDIYSLLNGGGYDPYGDSLKQQGLFQQQLAQATNPQAFMAAVGTNMGGMLGNAAGGLMGLKSEAQKQQEAVQAAMANTQNEKDPVKRLRAVAEALRGQGLEGAAMKVDEQADVYEGKAADREAKQAQAAASQAKAAKDAAAATAAVQLTAQRESVLKAEFPDWSEEKIKTVAADEKSFNQWVKPEKDYTPTEFERTLISSGMKPGTPEFQAKMQQFATLTLKAKEGDPASKAQAQLALLQYRGEVERQKAEKAQQAAATTRQKNQLSILMNEKSTADMVKRVDEAKKLVSSWTTGWGAFAFKDVPGSDARALRNKIDTIKSNIGFDKLQQMREASPTGGALGQVSERELYALQNVLANLDLMQTPEELSKALDEVQTHYTAFLKAQKQSLEAGEPLMGTAEAEALKGAAPAPAPAPTGDSTGGWETRKSASGVTYRVRKK